MDNNFKLGLIISAGNQTRFKLSVPKAAMKLTENGYRLIDANYDALKQHCDMVFIVCNESNKAWFTGLPCLVIDSGKGCGDAVYEAIKKFNSLGIIEGVPHRTIVQWGDSFVSKYTLEDLFDNIETEFGIPVYEEDNPYVSITPTHVYFSKYNEVTRPGYHDKSIFAFDTNKFIEKAEAFREKYLNKETGLYEHPHGNEFTFLDLINEGWPATIFPGGSESCFAFNTVAEFNDLKSQILHANANLL